MKTIPSILVLLTALFVPRIKDADEPTPGNAAMDAPFVNTLGMKFVPVPGTKVLFSIWDTRVKDFSAYAKATNYHQTGGMETLQTRQTPSGRSITMQQPVASASWDNPGFEQSEDHPVVGVNWDEANAFCEWLSKKEHRIYRLPTSAEWSAAAGQTKYAWGDTWPPPKGSGNLGDRAFYKEMNPSYHSDLGDYDDGYAWTSPVGKYSPNWLGLCDMAGNVYQWCEDQVFPDSIFRGRRTGKGCRIIRGSSWSVINWEFLLCSFEIPGSPLNRNDDNGFRCVLELPEQ